jgi:hypothetical protein
MKKAIFIYLLMLGTLAFAADSIPIGPEALPNEMVQKKKPKSIDRARPRFPTDSDTFVRIIRLSDTSR